MTSLVFKENHFSSEKRTPEKFLTPLIKYAQAFAEFATGKECEKSFKSFQKSLKIPSLV